MQLGTSFVAGYNHRLKCDGAFTVTQPTLSLDASEHLRDDLKFICVNPIAVLSKSQDSAQGFVTYGICTIFSAC